MNNNIKALLRKVLLVLSITFFICCKKDTTVLVTDTSYPQYGARFNHVPDPEDAIIYQVNLRAFSEEGTFKGVTARMDSIKALGVNVVYLMPIHPIGVLNAVEGLGSPYAVKDYKGVNPELGKLEDLRALVDAAHEREMAVILDWVAGHTAWDNAWISNKSWYKQDTNGNITQPAGTNWTDVAALDFANQEMRAAMIDAMKYWVFTANIDGFRCDAADNVPFDFWKQANHALKGISSHKLFMLAEGVRSDHIKAGFQMTFGFGYYDALANKVFKNSQSVSLLQGQNSSEYSGKLPGSQVVRYITNHDVYHTDGSPVNIYGGKAGSIAAFLVTTYMSGVPMIYNGQEVGSTRSINFFYRTPIDWTTNPEMKAAYKKIISFRKNSAAVKRGDLAVYGNDDVAAFSKSTSEDKVFVMASLRGHPTTYTVPADLRGSWKNAFTGASVTLNQQLFLQPYQYLVLTK